MFLVDIGDENGLMVFINPEILEVAGSQCGDEGCLSVPGESHEVERPNYVKVKALNEKVQEYQNVLNNLILIFHIFQCVLQVA